MKKDQKFKLSQSQIIILGFLIIILIGASLLSLPISSKTGEYTNFLDSLFTSVSATCVTGLVVFDTYTHWSVFGICVILTLIQIGGLGFMSLFTMISLIMGRNIGLSERKLIMQSTATFSTKGIITLMKRIVFGTLIIEGVGAVLLSFVFCKNMNPITGIFYSVFHSVSAFCNAGFDLMGKYKPFSSLTSFSNNYYVSTIFMILIIIGGIGFVIWNDIIKFKFNFKKYHLHSKITLTATLFLIIIPTILFFAFDYNKGLKDLPLGEKILCSFFQIVSPRTAGFNTIDLTQISDSSKLLMSTLMIIGGCPGSTAGGMKVTTLAVCILAVFSSIRNSPECQVYKRKIDNSIVKQATAISIVYVFTTILFTMIICWIDSFTLQEGLFEVASAIGTVGLTLGITTKLSVFSKIIILSLMFAGRIGGLTLIISLANKNSNLLIKYPSEKVLIG